MVVQRVADIVERSPHQLVVPMNAIAAHAHTIPNARSRAIRCSGVGGPAGESAGPKAPHEERQRGDFGKTRPACEHEADADHGAACASSQLEQRSEDEGDGNQMRQEPHVAELSAPPHVRAGHEEQRQKDLGRETAHAEPLGEEPRQRGRHGREK